MPSTLERASSLTTDLALRSKPPMASMVPALLLLLLKSIGRLFSTCALISKDDRSEDGTRGHCLTREATQALKSSSSSAAAGSMSSTTFASSAIIDDLGSCLSDVGSNGEENKLESVVRECLCDCVLR